MSRTAKYLILLTSIILFSVNRSFGETEEDVMKRYDYSSPRASYESFKKALKDNDFYGMYIHQWQGAKLMLPNEASKISFQDSAEGSGDKTALMKFSNNWYSGNGREWIKFTDTEFLKEEQREHDKGTTECTLTAERKSDGKQIKVVTFNVDGTNHWWILVFTGLEDKRTYTAGEDGILKDENGVVWGENAK